MTPPTHYRDAYEGDDEKWSTIVLQHKDKYIMPTIDKLDMFAKSNNDYIHLDRKGTKIHKSSQNVWRYNSEEL